MKAIHVLFILSIGLISCEEPKLISFKSTSAAPIEDKGLVIERAVFPGLSGSQKVLFKREDTILPAQHNDLDGDGTWDEVLLQLSFEPGEQVEVRYDYVLPEEYPSFPSRANAYLGHSPERNKQFTSVSQNTRPPDHLPQSVPYLYQSEGPLWESDVVAYRSYFDSRNGKDIFGKIKKQLYADSIGLKGNYHKLRPWGMDVLKVGNSLGAGALAMLKGDSVYRLGPTETATFQILEDGPLRARVRLAYTGWQVGGQPYDVTETLSIWAGKRWYISEVDLKGSSTVQKDTLVTGIVNLVKVPKTEFTQKQWNILYTFGEQSENQDNLGMALAIPQHHFSGYGEQLPGEAGVTDTFTAYLSRPAGGKYRFVFYSGWEKEHVDFSDEAKFRQRLEKLPDQMDQNIEIIIP